MWGDNFRKLLGINKEVEDDKNEKAEKQEVIVIAKPEKTMDQIAEETFLSYTAEGKPPVFFRSNESLSGSDSPKSSPNSPSNRRPKRLASEAENINADSRSESPSRRPKVEVVKIEEDVSKQPNSLSPLQNRPSTS